MGRSRSLQGQIWCVFGEAVVCDMRWHPRCATCIGQHLLQWGCMPSSRAVAPTVGESACCEPAVRSSWEAASAAVAHGAQVHQLLPRQSFWCLY
jgi:hypothetical protein